MDRGTNLIPPKFIYIMGRGHSGSTLLDAILGNSAQIESVGELASALGRVDTEQCSCGQMMMDCNYWQTIISGYKSMVSNYSFERFCKNSFAQANIRHFFKYLFYQDYNLPLLDESFSFFGQIAKYSGKSCILDSSKEHTRALLFCRSQHTYIIQVVRHPARILASTYFRAVNGEVVKFWRLRFQPQHKIALAVYIFVVGISWSVGQVFAELVKLVSRNKVLLIRYEDLINNPAEEVFRIQKALDLNLQDLIEKLLASEPLLIGHNVGGNRLRFQKSFTILPEKKSQRKLPIVFAWLTTILNLPFILYFRYHPFK